MPGGYDTLRKNSHIIKTNEKDEIKWEAKRGDILYRNSWYRGKPAKTAA
jgi:hypothetical protein